MNQQRVTLRLWGQATGQRAEGALQMADASTWCPSRMQGPVRQHRHPLAVPKPPETQLILEETAVSTAHPPGSQRGSPTESLPLQEASGIWNHAVHAGAKSAVGRDPLPPLSLPGGPTAPPAGHPYLLNPAAVLSAGPPNALLQPALQSWPQGQRNLPSAPPASSCTLLRPPPVHPTHPAPPGHSSPSPRPSEGPCSGTCTRHPSLPENLLMDAGAWRGHRVGHDSSSLAHILHPQPQLPSPLRSWAISYPRRLSATSQQGGCLRSQAWCLQTAAQSVFRRSLLWKDVKVHRAHDTGPTAPSSMHNGSGASGQRPRAEASAQ